jgi:cholest-4-en-3-one 26-monooxygenase
MARFPQTLDEIDFYDLEMFAEGDPHQAWRLLRAQAPVWFHDRPGGEPFWSVTRIDEAREVFGDAITYSSQRNGIMVRDQAMLESEATAARSIGIHPMIHTDPPHHVKLRRIVSPRFTPRSVAELEARVRELAVECVAEAVEKGEVDFVHDVAHRIPAALTFEMLGIPRERWDRLAELEHRTVTRNDPDFTHGMDPKESAAAASAEIYGYFAELALQRKDDPGDDWISVFLAARIDGEQLPWQQAVAEAGLLLAGGLDTTRAAASAGAVLPLLQAGDQRRDLWADPSLLPVAVEEFVRWASPIVSEARTVTADTTLAGVALREGDRVVVWGGSCNRDEGHFDEPDRFDIRRFPNRHIGFAYGEHFCLGSHLARLILRVEFEELIRATSDIEQLGEPVRVRSNFVGGLKRLPVRLIPR